MPFWLTDGILKYVWNVLVCHVLSAFLLLSPEIDCGLWWRWAGGDFVVMPITHWWIHFSINPFPTELLYHSDRPIALFDVYAIPHD